ncbi:MAG TPA: translation initiation factor IF-2 [Candidatus Paceibacterota bacterium]|nr:translation initiation factor IF-2 [Candidatus Paceibacterota bacterium]
MTKTGLKTDIIERSPVIAVMGHVDHGKSKLLDYIRKTNIVEKEAGGITQNTSAYEVSHSQKKITFIDTPGHSAFTTMRERGAQIADIAILVVSAEEGVKAQTLEALESIKEHNTPFVVAINKIDKPTANIENTKQSLAENNVFVEGYGGNVPFALISAKEGTGVNELLDLLILVSEMEELRGETKAPAEGFVLESHRDPKVGITATLIIKNGTLKNTDFIVVGNEVTKIKRLTDFLDKQVKELSFSAPAKIFGFNKLPQVGYPFKAFADKKEAECFAACHQEISCDCEPLKKEAGQVVLPIVIKADVAGTLEALEKELRKFSVEKVALNIIDRGVGTITENDVKLIQAFPEARIIGFRVKAEKSAVTQAEKAGITIQTSDIIYKLSEWLEEEMKKIAPKEKIEETVGRAKVLKTFSKDKDKQIIGATVVSGTITTGKNIKVIRRELEVGRGKILGLQMQKIKANEITEGNQFGGEIDARIEIAPGDYLEAFETVIK